MKLTEEKKIWRMKGELFMEKKEYSEPTVEVVMFENIGVDLPLSVKSDNFEEYEKNDDN